MQTDVTDKLIVPKHIAIIMDGNGRWAKKHGKERIEGHYEGVVSVRSAIESSLDLGVEVLTIYAFSTENWARPKDEVDGLMALFCKTISMEIPSLIEKKVKVLFVGDIDSMSQEIKEAVNFCQDKTSMFSNLTLCVALNYGAKSEITNAVKAICCKVCDGELKIEDINEQLIDKNLYTAAIIEPDLIIRTSGEQRLSNFLLWQAAYSEFYFTPILWPDFRKNEFFDAVAEFSRRNRRYGKV
ncbi:MAG: isoprenyl transferase [Rikenellaceae bacterium]